MPPNTPIPKPKKRQVAAPGCSPIVVFLISKQCKTARSIRAISYGTKKRQVAAPDCSPIVVFLISKQCKTARSIRAISYGTKRENETDSSVSFSLLFFSYKAASPNKILTASEARSKPAAEGTKEILPGVPLLPSSTPT